MTFFAKKTPDSRGQVYIYESIGEGWFGGITAKSFSDMLKELGNVKALDIYINSGGGSVFDGIAIYNQIRRFDGERVVYVDGIAASIASVIAMAGDKINIAANGMLMIHDPWGLSVGTSEDMRQYADSLDKVRDTIVGTYVAKTGRAEKEVGDWMAAETWMNAKESLDRGFATAIVEAGEPVSAQLSRPMLAKFKHTPPSLLRQSGGAQAQLARMQMRTMQLTRRPAGATA